MEPVAKVVYPTPPPTTNNLTTNQRSLLLRKAKKIEQILGYPPQLVDSLYNADERRSSVDSSSSSPTLVDSLGDKDGDSWFYGPHGRHEKGSRQVPLLRVASKSLHLEVTAVSWPAKPSIPANPSVQLPISESPITDSDPATIAIPTFTVPTSRAHRKAKMDRIRRRLGSEVPYEVVFPDNVEQGPSDVPARKEAPLPALPAPPAPSNKRPEYRHPPPPVTNVVIMAKPTNERLSLIPESPDEPIEGCREIHPRLVDRTIKRQDTSDSLSLCSRNSDEKTIRRRPSNYRKPPPPMLDPSICSF